MIEHSGGVNPYYGLLDDAIASECVFKPKPGYYCRTDYDVDKTTGEPNKMWKEAELYCAKFWLDLYKDEKFNKFVEKKFAFEDQELISATQDVLAMMEGKAVIPDEKGLVAEEESEEHLEIDSAEE